MEFKSKPCYYATYANTFQICSKGEMYCNQFLILTARQQIQEVSVAYYLIVLCLFQCAWRGYSVRKRFNTNKFKRTRQRILVANSNVTEPMKLCNRTRSALDYLLKCKNLTTVREAFLHLGKDLSRLLF